MLNHEPLRLADGEYRFACLVWDNEPLPSGQLVALAAEGLVRIIEEGGTRPVVLPSESPALPAGVRRVVVFLPEAPARLLATLKRAAALLARSATPLPMLFLSRSPASWLWSTLLHQVADRRLLSAVRAAASDLPVPSLAARRHTRRLSFP